MKILYRTLIGLALVLILSVVAFDSTIHFNAQRVDIKFKHYSAQRNWSLFYGQEYVFKDSSIRYESDFKEIARLVNPNTTLLSDLATSYYAAAQLSVFVVNLHRHQGQSTPLAWKQFISGRAACYLEFEENQTKFSVFVKSNNDFNYLLVNKDRVNSNRKRDCLAFRSNTLIEKLPDFADLIFEGEFLNLYAIK